MVVLISSANPDGKKTETGAKETGEFWDDQDQELIAEKVIWVVYKNVNYLSLSLSFILTIFV